MKYLIFKFLFKMFKVRMKRFDNKHPEDKTLPLDLLTFSSSFKYKNQLIEYNLVEKKDLKESYSPIIVHVHGGAWCYGDKDSNTQFHYLLASKGYKILSFSYTLCFKATLITQLKEINEFIRHLYSKKDEYKLDFNNLFIIGDSAGGQLTYLYSSILNSTKLKEIYSINLDNLNIKIKGIGLFHPTPYLKEIGYLEGHKNLSNMFNYGVQRMLYGKKLKNSKEYKFSDPNETFPILDSYIPTFLVSSKGDTLYSYESIKLKEDLDKFKIPHEFLFIDNKDCHHIFNLIYLDKKESIEVNDKLINYFNNLLS